MKFVRPIYPLSSFSRLVIPLLILQISVGIFAFPVNRTEAVGGTTYYVTNAGNDNCDGTSQTIGMSGHCAWKTIAKVNSSTFSPDDNILFKAGNAWREELIPPSSGASGTPIIFGSYGSGVQPIIDGSNVIASSSWTSTTTIPVTSATHCSGYAGGMVCPITMVSGDVLVLYSTNVNSYPSAATAPSGCVTWTQQGATDAYGDSWWSGVATSSGSCNVTGTAVVGAVFALWDASNVINTVDGTPAFNMVAGGATITGPQVTTVTNDDLILAACSSNNNNAGYQPLIQSPFISNFSGTDGWLIGYGYDVQIVAGAIAPSYSIASGGGKYYWCGTIAMKPSGQAGAAGTYYYTPTASEPSQVWLNGSRLSQVSNVGALSTGDWWWDAGASRIYIYDNPAGQTVTASVRDGININQSYVTITGLDLEYGNNGIIGTNPTGVTGDVVFGVTSQHNGNTGIFFSNTANSTTTPTTNLLITANTVQDNGQFGICLWGLTESSTISDNIVTGNGAIPWAVYGWSGIELYGDAVGKAPNGVMVTGNIVTLQHGDPLAPYWEGSGIQADNNSTNITILGNISANNQGNGILANQNNYVNIYNNLVYNNGTGMVPSYGNGVAISASNNDNVYNNTIYNSQNAGIDIYAGSAPITLMNNILMNNGNYEILTDSSETSGVVSNYNDIYHAAGGNFMGWLAAPYSWTSWKTNFGQDADSLTADPLFTDISGSYSSPTDFELQPSSPAIDAGANLGSAGGYSLDPTSTWPSNIILDNQNSYGSGWDIGAYVYTQTSTPSITMTAPAASATVSGTIFISASSSAVSPASISSISFYLDGSPLGAPITSTSTPQVFSYEWNTTGSSNGIHALYAMATDDYGNTASSSPMTVTVSNTVAPSIVVVVPASYAPAHIASPSIPSNAAIPSMSSPPSSKSDIQAMIDSLLAKLRDLQSQAAAASQKSSPYIFPRNLSWGMMGSDVKELQRYLVDQNKGPAAQRLKDHGLTQIFAVLTYRALVEFQNAAGINPASGYFGLITRAYVNGGR